MEKEEERRIYNIALGEAEYELERLWDTVEDAKPYIRSVDLAYYCDRWKNLYSYYEDFPQKAAREANALYRILQIKWIFAKEQAKHWIRQETERQKIVSDLTTLFMVSYNK